MKDVLEFSLRKNNASHVTAMKRDRRIRSEVGTLCHECRWVAGEHNQSGAEAESLIDVAETLNQPAAEKAGSARQQNAMAAYFPPQWSGVL